MSGDLGVGRVDCFDDDDDDVFAPVLKLLFDLTMGPDPAVLPTVLSPEPALEADDLTEEAERRLSFAGGGPTTGGLSCDCEWISDLRVGGGPSREVVFEVSVTGSSIRV